MAVVLSISESIDLGFSHTKYVYMFRMFSVYTVEFDQIGLSCQEVTCIITLYTVMSRKVSQYAQTIEARGE